MIIFLFHYIFNYSPRTFNEMWLSSAGIGMKVSFKFSTTFFVNHRSISLYGFFEFLKLNFKFCSSDDFVLIQLDNYFYLSNKIFTYFLFFFVSFFFSCRYRDIRSWNENFHLEKFSRKRFSVKTCQFYHYSCLLIPNVWLWLNTKIDIILKLMFVHLENIQVVLPMFSAQFLQNFKTTSLVVC